MARGKCPMTKLEKECIGEKCEWNTASERGGYCGIWDAITALENIKNRIHE